MGGIRTVLRVALISFILIQTPSANANPFRAMGIRKDFDPQPPQPPLMSPRHMVGQVQPGHGTMGAMIQSEIEETEEEDELDVECCPVRQCPSVVYHKYFTNMFPEMEDMDMVIRQTYQPVMMGGMMRGPISNRVQMGNMVQMGGMGNMMNMGGGPYMVPMGSNQMGQMGGRKMVVMQPVIKKIIYEQDDDDSGESGESSEEDDDDDEKYTSNIDPPQHVFQTDMEPPQQESVFPEMPMPEIAVLDQTEIAPSEEPAPTPADESPVVLEQQSEVLPEEEPSTTTQSFMKPEILRMRINKKKPLVETPTTTTEAPTKATQQLKQQFQQRQSKVQQQIKTNNAQLQRKTKHSGAPVETCKDRDLRYEKLCGTNPMENLLVNKVIKKNCDPTNTMLVYLKEYMLNTHQQGNATFNLQNEETIKSLTEPMKFMECVFRRHGLLSDKKVDVDMVQKSFSADAGSAYKTQVKGAVVYCDKQSKVLSPSGEVMTATGLKVLTQPLLIQQCVRSVVVQNKDIKEPLAKTNECENNRAWLKSCDNFRDSSTAEKQTHRSNSNAAKNTKPRTKGK